VHKNHNCKLHTFGVIVLCSFSFLNVVRSITEKVFKLLTLTFRGRYILLRSSAVHKKQSSRHHTFGFAILEVCPDNFLQ